MSDKARCETCRDITSYETAYEEITINLKSESIVFDGIVARCTICGNYIWCAAIEESNYRNFKWKVKENAEKLRGG